MNKPTLKRKILELARRLTIETDVDKMLEFSIELTRLVDEYKVKPENGEREMLISDISEFYEPNEGDINWAKMMLSIIKGDGIMAFPGSRLIYQVVHPEKKILLLNPQILLMDSVAFVTHVKTVAVFKKVGYSVV